jgi:hypothetical protein
MFGIDKRIISNTYRAAILESVLKIAKDENIYDDSESAKNIKVREQRPAV